jgi:amidohydrolase
VTVNDPALTARMLSSLHKVVGAERVREISLVMGAEDFSYYALEVPALFFFVGATPRSTPLAEAPSNHSPHFFLDEKALRIGLRGLLQLVADYGLLPGRG